MTVLCVGSINVDLIYRVPHLVRPGETLAASSVQRGLGGKGANQSIAAARAGAAVAHCGGVGPDAEAIFAQMTADGIDTSLIARLDVPSGQAVVAVDDQGENAIMLFEGANAAIPPAQIEQAVASLAEGDWVILQNEISTSSTLAARLARAAGAHVVYSAAPFDADAVTEVLPFVSLLLVNEGEAAALSEAGILVPQGVDQIITRGADGVTWQSGDSWLDQPAFAVEKVIDTTGAGDCFAGNLVAALSRGAAKRDALQFAQAAAAIQITRDGAGPAMPTRAETEAYLAQA